MPRCLRKKTVNIICKASGKHLTSGSLSGIPHSGATPRQGLHGLDEVDHSSTERVVQVLEAVSSPTVSVDAK